MDHLFDTIAIPVKCSTCGVEKVMLAVASLQRIIQSRGMECDDCGRKDWEARKPVYVPKIGATDDTEKRWRELCPIDFRTEAEGGDLRADRFKIDLTKEQNSFVWIWGGTGAGKTSSAWRLARSHFDRGNAVHHFPQLRFGTAYQEKGKNYEVDSWIASLCSVDALLFIDDIGKATWTQNAYGVFWEVVNTKVGNGSQTIITCQHSPDEMRKIWSNTPNAQEIATPFMRRANKGKIIQVK